MNSREQVASRLVANRLVASRLLDSISESLSIGLPRWRVWRGSSSHPTGFRFIPFGTAAGWCM
jgi:hypothetical protein